MSGLELDDFLRWALPRLRLRWEGYRPHRRPVGERLLRRAKELGLSGLSSYRDRLESDPQEWKALDRALRVKESRFWRDSSLWEALLDRGLPQAASLARAKGGGRVRAWSADCAAGEEPCSLLLAWALGGGPSLAGFELEVLGTDSDEDLLERARAGLHDEDSLRDLPAGWREAAFEGVEGGYALRPAFRRGLSLERRDLRSRPPDGPFDLVLCRHVAFTCFDELLQLEVLEQLRSVLRPGGLLVLGEDETLPAGQVGFEPFPRVHASVHRRLPS